MAETELNIPLSVVGPQEEAGPGGLLGALPAPENFAKDPAVVQQILDDVFPVVEWTRTSRTALEEEWRAIRRMEMLKHDEGRRYIGRSDTYMPVYSRILTTLVSNLVRGLFPSDEYMDVQDREGFTAPTQGMPGTPVLPDRDRSQAVKQYLQWEFERVANVRAHMKPYLRQYVNYGNSPLKFWYDKKVRHEGRLKLETNVQNIARAMSTFRPVTNYEGLRVSVRSIFYWYIYPLTAESLDDCTICFEDIDTPRAKIVQMGLTGRWENVEDALNAPPVPNHMSNQLAQVTDSVSLTAPVAQPFGGKDLGDVRTITEIWTRLKLPKRAYMPGEDTDEAIPVKLTMAGAACLEVTRNPFWHQKPPYVIARSNLAPGLFYGSAYGRLVRSLQYQANDFANQSNDCGNYTLNPINKVNPNYIAGPLRPLSPGVSWYLTDIDKGQRFDRPPIELIAASLQMVNQAIGFAQDFGGAPPVLQGSGAGKAAKTATGAQILQRNALGPLQDEVEDIELSTMIPLMYGAWCNAQQFRDQAVMTRVAGRELKVSPEDLAMDPEMRWLASSQSVNQQQRAQQGMGLLSGLMPLMPLIQAAGYQVNPVPLIQRVYNDGLGFRGFDDFITKAQPPQMPGANGQGAGPNAGMPLGASAPPGLPQGVPQNGPQGPGPNQAGPRSTLEQTPGGGVGLQPGEGGDFGQVRDNADSLAAMMGGSGGGLR